MKDVVKNEVIKLLDAGIIYPISDSKWVNPMQVVPKKSEMTVVKNENNEMIPTRLVTGWRMCVDYSKLNVVTRKDHFPLPFIDQILEKDSWPYVLLLPRWLFGLLSDRDYLRRSRKDHFHLPFWYLRLSKNAIWAM